MSSIPAMMLMAVVVVVVVMTAVDVGVCICPHQCLKWIILCWFTQLPSQIFSIRFGPISSEGPALKQGPAGWGIEVTLAHSGTKVLYVRCHVPGQYLESSP